MTSSPVLLHQSCLGVVSDATAPQGCPNNSFQCKKKKTNWPHSNDISLHKALLYQDRNHQSAQTKPHSDMFHPKGFSQKSVISVLTCRAKASSGGRLGGALQRWTKWQCLFKEGDFIKQIAKRIKHLSRANQTGSNLWNKLCTYRKIFPIRPLCTSLWHSKTDKSSPTFLFSP